MTDLLEKAFDEVEKLPEGEQQAFAAMILDEIHSERQWKKTFRETSGSLQDLAEEARREYRDGETEPLSTSQN